DDADLEGFARATTLAAADPNTDALLVLLAPQATVNPVEVAEELRPLARAGQKPILACWLWGAMSPCSAAVLQEAGVHTFRSADAAIRTFGYLWRHGENLRRLAELATVLDEGTEQDARPDRVTPIIATVRRSGRTVLTRAEWQQLLSIYSLPTVKTRFATSEGEAVELAQALRYPVVLGLACATGPAARETEGIQLKAFDASAVRRAFHALRQIAHQYSQDEPAFRVQIEPLIRHDGCAIALRSRTHRELGPVLQFGVGGRWATLARDRVTALPPLGPQAV